MKQLLAQLVDFLGVKYSHYKKAFTLYYTIEYDLQKVFDFLKSKFTIIFIFIDNFKYDR